MQREVVETIRQQSDDLREELKDLERWENDMELEKRKRQRKVPDLPTEVEVPIRGTVPSLKQAITDSARKLGKQLPPRQDPINLAKEKGNECFRAGRISDAIHAYSSGIDLDPHSGAAHILYANRAMCFLRQGQWVQAEEDASMCIQLNRSFAKGYYRRAVARKNLKKLKEARGDLESVLALAPGDSSAVEEMEVVTKLLQAERATASSPPAAKRRIVIEEVEDEDEVEEAISSAGTVSADTKVTSSAAEEEKGARAERAQREMEAELARVRREQDAEQQRQRMTEEKEMAARRKQSTRVVEIIDEDVPEVIVATPGPSAPSTKAENSAAPMMPKASFADPVNLAGPSKSSVHATAPVVAAAAKLQENLAAATAVPAAVVEKTSRCQPAVFTPKAALRLAQKPSKESLKGPQSFTELERVFSDVASDEGLRNHYVNLIDPSSLPQLVGNNMTPELLVGILHSLKALPGSKALRFLKALSSVRRVEELTLFFDGPDQKVVEELLSLVKSSGASEKDLSAITRKLKPMF